MYAFLSILSSFPLDNILQIRYSVEVRFWPYRLTVRTKASQALNQSSILCRVTRRKKSALITRLFSWVTLSEQIVLLTSENRRPQ